MPKCASCKSVNVVKQYDICDACATKKALQRNNNRGGGAAQQTLVWTTTSRSGGSRFTYHAKSLFTAEIDIDEATNRAMSIIRSHHADTEGLQGANNQKSEGESDGTTSVDWQGSPASKDGSAWVNIQGQMGKSSQRTTVFHLMVQCHATAMPPKADVKNAINESFGTGTMILRYDPQKMPN